MGKFPFAYHGLLIHPGLTANETLAPDEIDRLLAPKALSNFKKYDKNGEHKVESISLDDNLIIKGNNLLALHSLKNKYEGKVKLIYIDPPYNTGSDSFGYNDSFNHSTWLTFMRTRLEIAKILLKDDGSIWINIDDSEAHYLKIVADEVFKKDSFLGTVIWQHSIQGKGYAGKFSLHHNYILCYAKTEQFALGQIERTENHNVNYKNPDNDPNGRWRLGDIRNSSYRLNLIYVIDTPSGNEIQPPKNG
ncbi:cytosine methyltransferase, partial [Methylococcaceae bacterium CS1]